MKSKFYAVLMLVAAASQVFAQCGDRYKEEVFQNFTTTVDTYTIANGVTLLMNVYQPDGDVETSRPVIVMAHGGSFIQGDKDADPTVVNFCQQYAKRGYVTASISYRLGNPISMYLDSNAAKEVVIKAISDGKAAIRYFRKDAATANKYKVNPNIIFAGGNSAGAVLFSHVAYIDSVAEVTPDMQALITANGGIEGNSGNAGYSSKIQGLVNFAGGLNLPELIGPGNTPSANFHGDEDATVPYYCANAVGGQIQVRLCGLGVLQPLITQYGISHVSKVYSAPNAGHVPWQNNAAIYEDVDTTTRNFLYELMCSGEVGQPVGINDVADIAASVRVFPNPTKEVVNVSFGEATFKSVQLIDATGRVVEAKAVDNNTVSFNRNSLTSGLYFVKAMQANGNTVTKKVIFE